MPSDMVLNMKFVLNIARKLNEMWLTAYEEKAINNLFFLAVLAEILLERSVDVWRYTCKHKYLLFDVFSLSSGWC